MIAVKNSDGAKFDYVATGNVVYHELIVAGNMVGVASKAGVSGDIIACEAEGVFTFEKPTTGVSFNQGALVYLDSDGKIATSGTVLVGCAWDAAAEADGTVNVKINAVSAPSTAVDLSTATGVLGVAHGGTGLSALGTAGQVLATNSGATAIEWATKE